MIQALNDWYPLAYKVVVWLTVPAAVGFPIWYHLKLQWRSSEMGRHVMGYSAVVALLYVTSILRLTFPGMPAQRIMTLTLAVLMMTVVWWRVLVFVHIYRQTRQEREDRLRQERNPDDVPKVSGE
jgi:hypothetical protein